MESFLLEFYKTLKFGKIKYKNMTHRQLSLKTRSKNPSYLMLKKKKKKASSDKTVLPKSDFTARILKKIQST